MLYDAGAKEVHVKIACPEIKYPDFYGVDTPTKKELLAANKSNDEICEYIGAKSLKFLSLNGLYKAIGFENRNQTYPQLTDHYFTGDYPVEPIDELGDFLRHTFVMKSKFAVNPNFKKTIFLMCPFCIN